MSRPSAGRAGRPKSPVWIISRSDDLTWIIGSVVASYAFLLAFWALGVPVYGVILVWVLLFDGPHIFGTVSRTYLDADERARRAPLLYGSLVLFAVGPLMAVLPRFIPNDPSSELLGFLKANSFVLFVFIASIWAYHHIVMQHYGFMVLYKKKNGDLDPPDNLADRLFLTTLLMAPFLFYMLREPEAREMWPWPLPPKTEFTLVCLGAVASVVAAIVFAIGLTLKIARGAPLDVPKLLFLSAVIPMHWTVLLSPLAPRVMVPILTVSHNLQYHRLIWFHNTNKYRNPSLLPPHGAASYASRSLRHYYLLGVLFALYRVPNVFLLDNDLAVGFFWGFSLVHYFLDSRIWAVRKDPHLASPLRLAQA
jgi:hypothetical protein